MLQMLHDSVMASTIFYGVVYLVGSMKVVDTKRRNKLIRKAGLVVGKELDDKDTVAERRTLSKV